MPLPTIKRHLEYLELVGRVHVEDHGGLKLYYLNGDGRFNERIQISPNKQIYIDLFYNPWGQPYIRIRERKRDKITGKWEDRGAIIIDPKFLDEFIIKLKRIRQQV